MDRIIQLITDKWPMYLEGLQNTLIIAIIGTIIGVIGGFFFAIVRNMETTSRDSAFVKILKIVFRRVIIIYVDVVRGTPMMLQAIILFYYFSNNGFRNLMVISILVVGLNTIAYSTEVIRSGINGVDKGQLEAARSLGLTHKMAMLKIILPQAFKNSVPAIGNELIVNVKDTAVLSVIGVLDLKSGADSAASKNYFVMESMIIAAAIYLTVTMTLTRLLTFLDAKINTPSSKEKGQTFPTSQTVPEVIH